MGKKIHGDFGFIFWLHVVLIILFLASPFLISWQYVLLIIMVLLMQTWTIKDCVLTKAQLSNNDSITKHELSFYVYYFRKFGWNVNARKVKFYVAYILPWGVLIIALLWQPILNKAPIWF